MRRLCLIITLLGVLVSFAARADEPVDAPLPTDSVAAAISLPTDSVAAATSLPTDSIAAENSDRDGWWKRLWSGRVDPYDKNDDCPAFVKFCLKTYYWIDHTFNYYDPEYVQPSDKLWKVMLQDEFWTDSYLTSFRNPEGDLVRMSMASDFCNHLGGFFQFSIICLAYSHNMTGLLANRAMNLSKTDLILTCSRFTLEAYIVENSGGTTLRRHSFENSSNLKIDFPGLKMNSFGLDAMYIFNFEKYSHGAAYGFANAQIKSAGSWMAGFSFTNQNVALDFTTLPDYIYDKLDSGVQKIRFHYNDYAIVGGYGYTWVFAPHFMLNVTLQPGVGITHNDADSYEPGRNRVSLNFKAQAGLQYWVKDFFCGINGRFDSHWYVTPGMGFYNGVMLGSMAVGFRF